MKHIEYTNLWREIASRHLEIGYTAQKMHFARLVLTRDPFFNTHIQISEFINSLRNKLLTPCMLVASYTADYDEENGGSVRKILNGRMLILDNVEQGNYDNEEEILEYTEQIGEECMAYAQNYFILNPEKGFFVWGGNDKLSGLSGRNFSGSGFDFSIITHSSESTIYDPEKFNLDG